MKKIATALVLSIGLLGIAHASEWTMSKQSKGVDVFTKALPNSPLKAFKGVAQVDASMSALIAVMEDIPAYKNWMYNIIQSDSISETSETTGIVYVVQKAPIVKDRDISFEYTVTKVGDSVQFEFRESPTAVPATDLVRIQYFRGMFKLTPKGSGVEVVYEVAADPGGSIPAMVANAMAVDIPVGTLSSMKKVNMAQYEGKNRFRYD